MRKTLTEQEIEQKMNDLPLWVLSLQSEIDLEKITKQICKEEGVKDEFFQEILYCTNMVCIGAFNGKDFMEYIKDILKDYDATLPIVVVSRITEDIFTPLRKKIREYKPPEEILAKIKNTTPEKPIIIEKDNLKKEKTNTASNIVSPYNLSSDGIEIENEEKYENNENILQNSSQNNLEELTKLIVPKKPKK